MKASDPDTMEWCSKLIGRYDKEKDTSGYNADMLGLGKGTSTSTTTEQRYIIEPEEFDNLGDRVVCKMAKGFKVLEKIKPWNDKAFSMYVPDKTTKK